VTQFSEPFNSFFRHVIQPVAKRVGLEAFRGSDVYKPGIILEDILRDMLESEVIIAEITSGNPNVFYELGYAHALGKQTILLADRATAELPFDIRGYRVIFYENTIKGKPDVERELEEHLNSIMKGFK
jgi:nucleoside 2-deoxyribosyltransferase